MLGSISDFFAVWMWLVLIILIIGAGIAAAVKVHSVTKERIYENSVNSYLSGTKKELQKYRVNIKIWTVIPMKTTLPKDFVPWVTVTLK